MTQTYVVSGSASGIGAALSARLMADGHRVVGVDLRDADVVADLSTPAGRADAVREVRSLLEEPIAGIVPCAGVAGLTGVDPALVVSVNFFGAVHLVEGLRDLLGPGSSVVVLSSNSVTCQPGWPTDVAAACLAGPEDTARAAAAVHDAVQVYPATKSALADWARRRAAEWGPSGVRVNAIAPGMIATPMTERLRDDPVLGAIADAYPSALGRPGRPEEVATAIAWLLSEEASLVTGSVLLADGGTDALLNP